MPHDFDQIIDRRGTHADKWDMMQKFYGVSPDDGIAMWVADTDFRSPDAVIRVVAEAAERGVFGYFGDNSAYLEAVCGWMKRRHGWDIRPEWINTVAGLGSGVGFCLQAYTQPGDGVILFTPVYHSFARLIKTNERVVVESSLRNEAGRYYMDLEALEANLTGRERMVIFCSPHNPGGRVWDAEEIHALAAFCEAHDLVLVSDEVHHDLVYPGAKHTISALAAQEYAHRLVTLAAPSKTFNTAGADNGVSIISDENLRAAFHRHMRSSTGTPNWFGMLMTTAAYNEGEEWLEEQIAYLDENRRVFDAGMNAIPGVQSMHLDSTYLAWVDFSGTGMAQEEVYQRIQKGARIAASHGPQFGTGGDLFMRFNLGMPKARIVEAVARLQAAFSDLQ